MYSSKESDQEKDNNINIISKDYEIPQKNIMENDKKNTKTSKKSKGLNENKSQKNFIIKKKKHKKKTLTKKTDEFQEHFKQIIEDIDNDENNKFNDHLSDEFEEGRSDSESSTDDLEVIFLTIFYKLYLYIFKNRVNNI